LDLLVKSHKITTVILNGSFYLTKILSRTTIRSYLGVPREIIRNFVCNRSKEGAHLAQVDTVRPDKSLCSIQNSFIVQSQVEPVERIVEACALSDFRPVGHFRSDIEEREVEVVIDITAVVVVDDVGGLNTDVQTRLS
jgi:hypothetical protein